MQNFQAAYFAGNTRIAEVELERARTELSATGRPELAARAELFRCALQTASLEFDDCPGYRRYAADAGAPERAYAAYLTGNWEGLNATALPSPQQSVLARGSEALFSIGDPLSRLVAAGALARAGRISPAGIGAALDAASANGWRRPLLAWLGVELIRAEAARDEEAVARLRRRMDLAGGENPPK